MGGVESIVVNIYCISGDAPMEEKQKGITTASEIKRGDMVPGKMSPRGSILWCLVLSNARHTLHDKTIAGSFTPGHLIYHDESTDVVDLFERACYAHCKLEAQS